MLLEEADIERLVSIRERLYSCLENELYLKERAEYGLRKIQEYEGSRLYVSLVHENLFIVENKVGEIVNELVLVYRLIKHFKNNSK